MNLEAPWITNPYYYESGEDSKLIYDEDYEDYLADKADREYREAKETAMFGELWER